MGSIFQQPSNFLIKPVRPCLNLTCKRYCMKTQIRQHITCVDQRDWQCFKVLQYDFFCSGQQKHELTRCQTTRGISRLLPAPLQLLASTLHQARLFLILLPENETLSLSWYLPLGWDFGSFPLIRNSLAYYYYQWEYILYSPQFYARNSMPGPHFLWNTLIIIFYVTLFKVSFPIQYYRTT